MAISGVNIGVIKFTTNGVLTGTRQVGFVRWVGGSIAGHTAILKDGNGAEWFKGEADGANYTDIHPIYAQVNGLNVALSSGALYVYTR